jgi:hypothetical protein
MVQIRKGGKFGAVVKDPVVVHQQVGAGLIGEGRKNGQVRLPRLVLYLTA